MSSGRCWRAPQAGQTQPRQSNIGKSEVDAKRKFEKLQRENLESAKRFTEHYDSSSGDDEGQDREAVAISDIFSSVFKGYSGDSKDLQKTQHFLENAFQTGAATCLICIATVKRSEPIWSCGHCYCFFHLACIQRWANDSMGQKKLGHDQEEGYYTNTGEYVPKRQLVINWDCPKCRATYEDLEIPYEYKCFCGKETDPAVHLWSIPHSCGDVCGRPLKPSCGHKCVLLCHPGPCPPCLRWPTFSLINAGQF